MPDINVLQPIDEQTVDIIAPNYLVELALPGNLTHAYPDQAHAFDFTMELSGGYTQVISGSLIISGQGQHFDQHWGPWLFDQIGVPTNFTTGFTTPIDWTATSIDIKFTLASTENLEAHIKIRNFRLRVTLSTRRQYLPILGIG